MRTVRISSFGGPEVLELVEDAPVPEAGDGQVLVRVTRAGVNFADTHARDNSYPAAVDVRRLPHPNPVPQPAHPARSEPRHAHEVAD